ncbi:hypothetical protein [Armatimonas sp.]|uniref:hypothetical protein n=1 Tax=Armatimonas sp. TaxID=1872638 RepID=UPI0037521D34
MRKLGIGLAIGILSVLFFLPQTGWLLRGLLRGIVAAALWQPLPVVRAEGSVSSWPLLLLATWSLVALLATLFCGSIAGIVLANPRFWGTEVPKARVQVMLLLALVGGAAWWGAGAAQLIGGRRIEGALSGVILLFPMAIAMLALSLKGRQQGKKAPVSILTGLATLSLPAAFSLSLLCSIFLMLTARP